MVTNTADSGLGSLRQAILEANSIPGPNTIEFHISPFDPGFEDVDSTLGGDAAPDAFVIQLLSPLPALNDPTGGTKIDGFTQTAFGGDTNPFGPEIVLDGHNLPDDFFLQSGLFLFSNSNQVMGLNIQQFPSIGIDVRRNNNWIAGNYIGTDATGTLARANGFGLSSVDSGISIGTFNDAANLNVVGTNGDSEADEAERNVISGNGKNGVVIQKGSGNVVAGNFIGSDATGTAALVNGANGGDGVRINFDASSNQIGTDGDGENDAVEANPEFVDRLNESFFLRHGGADATVLDDEARDLITGSAGSDWYFANLDEETKDKITDLNDEELAPFLG